MIIDYQRVMGLARWVRDRCAYLDSDPPYSSKHVFDTCFPKIAVTGSRTLPRNCVEMALHEKSTKRRAVLYKRGLVAQEHRFATLHGLYHHLSDLRVDYGLRECNEKRRENESAIGAREPIEVECDQFAAEVLVPLEILDRFAPTVLYSDNPVQKRALEDARDHLASRFNVTDKLMAQRLYELNLLRKSYYNPYR